MSAQRLLTQVEVAKLLRCSVSKVKRLRQSGKLAYLSGRPVLVDEADLDAYKESVKRHALPTPVRKGARVARPTNQKSEPETPSALARRLWLARKNFQRDKSNKS
ncbi:helix-turn-helix domain-containing protein [Mesorhizobium sp. M1307]|uniref:helix-turn-helix domain-containing protein n=1 Tax=Mesorhizobium sp. M1307 TaxID=2957079 RepID=UPI00333951B7